MANPPKKKGTGGEREVVNFLLAGGLEAKRTPASAPFDVAVRGSTGRTLEVLATRPDNGKWLATIRLEDLRHLLMEHGDNAHIEVKRFARVSLHSVFHKKFGL